MVSQREDPQSDAMNAIVSAIAHSTNASSSDSEGEGSATPTLAELGLPGRLTWPTLPRPKSEHSFPIRPEPHTLCKDKPNFHKSDTFHKENFY